MASSTIIETHDWIASVTGIPVILPPPGVPFAPDDKPTEDDMGVNDPDSIIYVNLRAKKIPAKFNERLQKLDDMLNLTHQWLDVHAGIQTKNRKKEGKLPSDQSDASAWKRSDYRVKVVDTLLSENCAWIYNPEREDFSKGISVKKVQFHLDLLKHMIAGLAVPTGIQSKLEEAFKGLSELIIKTEKTSENRAVWVLFHVYTYDERRDDIVASLRNISYRISQNMKKIVVGKSSYNDIEVDFAFARRDYKFNEETWNKIHPEIKTFIDDTAAGQVRNPINDEIPVD
ncbi:hypothetical protein B7463_g1574, partial [Scytalidium lignicola]